MREDHNETNHGVQHPHVISASFRAYPAGILEGCEPFVYSNADDVVIMDEALGTSGEGRDTQMPGYRHRMAESEERQQSLTG